MTFWPRLDVVHHLALYRSFHRARTTKILHGMFVPVILLTGMQLLVPTPLVGWRLPVAMSVGMCALLALVDPLGSLLLGLFLAAGAIGATTLADHFPWWSLVAVAAVVHAAGWWLIVLVAHQRFEPHVRLVGRSEDSNVYFRRGYYTAQNLGTRVGALDRWIQFLIAPLSVVQDGLAAFGLRRGLERRCEAESAVLLERLARGEPPMPNEPVKERTCSPT